MKNFLLTLTLFLCTFFSTPAFAQDACASLGEMAASIMQARQSGIPLSQMMQVVNNTLENQEATTPEVEAEVAAGASLARELVLAAYETHRWAGDEMIARAIQDFRNEVERACYSN